MQGIRGFWPLYGCKWRSALHYPPPRYGTIIEACAGAAGYSCRYPERQIVLVEADPEIAELWRWLIRATPSDVLRLPAEVPTTVRDLGLDPGPAALIGFWLNHAVATPRQRPSAWMRLGNRPGSFWGPQVRARIAGQVGAIKHWRLIEGQYDRAPDLECTWLIDPPYQGPAGRHYRQQIGSYAHLALWTMCRKGQVIACEGEGATWLPFQPLGTFKSLEGRKGGKRSREVIWTNEVIGAVCGRGP